jgi:hypothetical protein
VENTFLVQEGSRLEDVVANRSDLLQIKEGFFVLVELVKIAVHQLEDERHLF